MKSLLFKEFRQLLPLGLIALVIIVVSFGEILLTHPLDEFTLYHDRGQEGTSNDSLYVLALIAIIVGFSLLPREHEERTIEFLYSLPVARRDIFLAKVTVALGFMGAGLLIDVGSDWILQSFNPQSFVGEQFRWDAVTASFILDFVCSFIFLSHAVLFSFFRRFGLIAYAIVWVVILSIGQRPSPFDVLMFSRLLHLDYDGMVPVIPWGPLGLHVGIALVCLVLAGFLWVGRAERFSALYERMRERAWGKAIMIASAMALAILVIAVVSQIPGMDEEDSNPPDQVGSQLCRMDTQHYTFVYTSDIRNVALSAVTGADEAFENVMRALDAPPGQPIVVDFTDDSTDYAGLASGEKIRLQANPLTGSSQRVLLHETTHVMADRQSSGIIGEDHNATKVFNEGLAEYVAFKFSPDESEQDAMRLLSAASWDRHRISFEEMVDVSLFDRKHDPGLVYAMGLTLIEAVVEACGEPALPGLLRAMARKDAPEGLTGRAFWEESFQAAGCDLEGAVGAWEGRMAQIVRERESDLQRIPRMSGGVDGLEKASTIFKASAEPWPEASPGHFILRWRRNPEDDETKVLSFPGASFEGQAVLFKVPKALTTGFSKRFQFQLGFNFSQTGQVFFEDWQSASGPE